MANILTRVVLPAVTGLPEDECVNTFVFRNDSQPDPANIATGVHPVLERFYNEPFAGNPVSENISEAISRVIDSARMESYALVDLTGATPMGPPVAVHNWTVGPVLAGLTPLPSEVAVTVSFHANLDGILEEGPGGIRPRARRRGRIYLGPLTTNTGIEDPVTHELKVGGNIQARLVGVSERLHDEVQVHASWCVWSRASAALHLVEGGFVDDAFDIQRRRGQAPTTRVSWTG